MYVIGVCFGNTLASQSAYCTWLVRITCAFRTPPSSAPQSTNRRQLLHLSALLCTAIAMPEDKDPPRSRLLSQFLRALALFTLFCALLLLGWNLAPRSTPPSWQSHIKHVVVLVQENLSFDSYAGGLAYNPGIDGLLRRQRCNPYNISADDSAEVCGKPIAENVAPDDPDHSISGSNMQIYGTYHPGGGDNASMQGFVTEQVHAYEMGAGNVSRAAEVINYHSPENVPVLSAMAENFVLFDRWFAAVPGPTNPNRAYLTSGASHGHGMNDGDFLNSPLPQPSIFQQLTEANISWVNYSNTTDFLPDAMFYTWAAETGKNETHVMPIDQFYEDAESGNLPQFSWINPECCSFMSFHPPSPIKMGEGFIKSIYEALRSSPQWDETLFILTFDEHGGFADHVPPPEGVPPGDNLNYAEEAGDGKPTTFHFDRLGIRVPTVLMSPWVSKGVVQNRPSDQTGEFTHTSILKFLSHLWDLDILTPRVEWSSSFHDLITDSFRDDTPTTLPEPADF